MFSLPATRALLTGGSTRRPVRYAAARRLGLLVAAGLLAGCANLGPDMVRAGRNDYNVTIQATNDEQLLLNLVRLRYRDTPMFLEVSSVATHFELNAGVNANRSFQTGPDVTGLGGQLGYSEQPTVTYTPLQGEDFVQRMLSPVTAETLLLLYHSGWSIERVLRLAVQRLNGIENAPGASGPTPLQAPRYEAFLQVTGLLRQLQTQGALDLGVVQEGDERFAALTIDPAAAAHDEVHSLLRMLGLRPGQAYYRLAALTGRGSNNDSIGVSTRSLMGILFFLSQAVEVPGSDRDRGRVTVTLGADGAVFDWLQVTRNLFTVQTSIERPTNAAVAVDYRGAWFYIDDSDLDSKSTFSLLAQLFALQSGKTKGTGPVLTLPVGR